MSLALTGCAAPSIEHFAVDLAMGSAYRPPPAIGAAYEHPRYDVLAGDLHCHVLPPDDPSHVSRTLADTIDLAKEEGLDFVVVTPHVWARFFEDADLRSIVIAQQRAMRSEIARRAGDVTVIAGMEYTDHAYGHAGLAFADVERVLDDVPLALARAHPERFFERWVAHGGTIVVNHPLLTPLGSIARGEERNLGVLGSTPIARADLSWRPFTQPRIAPFPAEIAAIDRLAFGFEAFNLTASHLRDRYLVGDGERTINATLDRLDREIPARGARMTPVGGSDSHSHHLRATTFVLATDRTPAAIRDALVAGRVCIKSPAACTLEARGAATGWVTVGGQVRDVDALDVRARGDRIAIIVDGKVVARPSDGAVTRLPVTRSACHVVRARVGESFSAPIYVNCSVPAER